MIYNDKRVGCGVFCALRGAAVFSLCLLFAVFMSGKSTPAWSMGQKPRPYAVGVRSLSVSTLAKAQLSVLVWYPSNRSNQSSYATSFGRWVMAAEKNAVPAKVQSAVILFSHDMVSGSLAGHELASYLAGEGFVVISPTHSGDSFENADAVYSAALLYYRPIQMHEALYAVAKSPFFAEMLDLQRVGLLGAGAGALTCLQLCGVDIDTAGYAGYCAAEDDNALCSNLARARFAQLRGDMREIRARHGAKAFAPPLAHVKALGLLTPGVTSFARAQDLSALRVPLAVLFAENDGLYYSVHDGEDVLRHFPRPLYDSLNYQIVAGADHYSLSSQCPPDMVEAIPELCGNASDSSRARFAETRNSYFASFFLAALGIPAPRP